MNKDELWLEYSQSKAFEAFIRALGPESFVAGGYAKVHLLLDDIHSLSDYKSAMKLLKSELDEHTVLTIRSRFRSYKYRKGHSKKTILMNKQTHSKIMELTKGMEADTFDEALEYVLQERYRSIWDLPIEDFNHQRYDDDELHINAYLAALSERERSRVVKMLESYFLSGWQAAKRSRSNKKTAPQDALKRQFKSDKVSVSTSKDSEKS
ncbi:hypothetical protein [Alteromonas gracilis]|uniref:hypothetical protein n=1 Tax=Alteromonas gracilis TaxID=1479524 RepID=UPI00373536FB